MRSRLFQLKFKRTHSGLLYLIVVGLLAAVAANAFSRDKGVLLVPVVLVIALMVSSLFAGRRPAQGL